MIINVLQQENMENELEEIRIRVNLPIIMKSSETEIVLKQIITKQQMEDIVQKICENSLYAYQKQIAQGYITIQGGNRVGIVGSGVLKENEILHLNYISGLNFRISRQIKGCSETIIEEILNRKDHSVYNTLIASPPGLGKTTLLKDIILKISNGVDGFQGLTVSVIDERGELAASYKGIAQNDLGIRTDILDNVPKSIGMKMTIRSMAPKVIIADEIGKKEDVETIIDAFRCGIKGIFTAHANQLEDLMKNPVLQQLFQNKVLNKIMILKKRTRNQIEYAIYSSEQLELGENN